MWHCSSGTKILSGPLLATFLFGFDRTMDVLSGWGKKVDLPSLSKIPKENRLDVMAYLGKHMILDEKSDVPLLCWSEGAIFDAFLSAGYFWKETQKAGQPMQGFETIRHLVLDMRLGDHTTVESLMAVVKDGSDEEFAEEFNYPCDLYTGKKLPQRDWNELIDYTSDAILWDGDFLFDWQPMAPAMAYMMGINADYFTAPLPKFTPDERAQIFRDIKMPQVIARAVTSSEVLALDQAIMTRVHDKPGSRRALSRA